MRMPPCPRKTVAASSRIDTVARTTLMLVSGKQTFVDDKDQRQPAIKWLLDVMSVTLRDADKTIPHRCLNYKVFRIENDQVLSLLGLEPRSATHFRYAYRGIQRQNRGSLSSRRSELVIMTRKMTLKDCQKNTIFSTPRYANSMAISGFSWRWPRTIRRVW